MRQAFAHEAVLSMGDEADEGAPGAAVMAALCGRWEHEPPCPLSPHHVRSERVDDDLHVRVLFALTPRTNVRYAVGSNKRSRANGRSRTAS
jgi:hypothetical protein